MKFVGIYYNFALDFHHHSTLLGYMHIHRKPKLKIFYFFYVFHNM